MRKQGGHAREVPTLCCAAPFGKLAPHVGGVCPGRSVDCSGLCQGAPPARRDHHCQVCFLRPESPDRNPVVRSHFDPLGLKSEHRWYGTRSLEQRIAETERLLLYRELRTESSSRVE